MSSGSSQLGHKEMKRKASGKKFRSLKSSESNKMCDHGYKIKQNNSEDIWDMLAPLHLLKVMSDSLLK